MLTKLIKEYLQDFINNLQNDQLPAVSVVQMYRCVSFRKSAGNTVTAVKCDSFTICQRKMKYAPPPSSVALQFYNSFSSNEWVHCEHQLPKTAF